MGLLGRQQIAQRYAHLLDEAGIHTTPYIEPHNTSVYAQYTIRVSDREAVQDSLKDVAVPTAVHYPIPLNKQLAVADETVVLPAGDEAAKHVISLPMHPYLESIDQEVIAAAVTAACSKKAIG